jgi:hypothetical protein
MTRWEGPSDQEIQVNSAIYIPDYNKLEYIDTELVCRFIKNREFLDSDDLYRLLERIKYDPILKCWFRCKDWSNYSKTRVRGKLVQTHRLMFELFICHIVNENVVRHTCNRKGCCNPWHLLQGTQTQNRWDSVISGRTTYGLYKP